MTCNIFTGVFFYFWLQKSCADDFTSDSNNILTSDIPSLSSTSTEVLDDSDRVILSWEVDESKTQITFELWAKTNGYVGFGISPTGGMTGADIFIGGVLPDGTLYFSDRFASTNEIPKLDSHEDWSLLSAKENATFTYLKFARFINTCDKLEDFPIPEGTVRVIWALGETDDLDKHSIENRGTRSIYLLSALLKPQEIGLSEWISEFSFELNGQETTYWVSFHEAFPLDTDKFVVAYDKYLPNKLSLKHVHHMEMFDCTLPEDGSLDEVIRNLTVGSGYKGYNNLPIDESSPGFKPCLQKILFSWAAGSKMVTFPEDVAYKVSKINGNRKKYFALQMHIHNPERIAGLTVTGGIKVMYSDRPRKYDAGYFAMEYKPETILIPPYQKDFMCICHCSPTCTNDKISKEGISVFSVQLHAHTSARKIKLRHFRHGEELPWISFDNHFDFHYQMFRQLDEPRKIYPGDQLVAECSYDSNWNNGKAVLGGTSSKDEMCNTLLWYYPQQNNFMLCGSHYNKTRAFLEVGYTKFHPTDVPDEPEVDWNDYTTFANEINWTPEFIKQLEYWRRFGDHFDQCSAEVNEKPQHNRFVRYPDIVREYLPEDVCNKT